MDNGPWCEVNVITGRRVCIDVHWIVVVVVDVWVERWVAQRRDHHIRASDRYKAYVHFFSLVNNAIGVFIIPSSPVLVESPTVVASFGRCPNNRVGEDEEVETDNVFARIFLIRTNIFAQIKGSTKCVLLSDLQTSRFGHWLTRLKIIECYIIIYVDCDGVSLFYISYISYFCSRHFNCSILELTLAHTNRRNIKHNGRIFVLMFNFHLFCHWRDIQLCTCLIRTYHYPYWLATVVERHSCCVSTILQFTCRCAINRIYPIAHRLLGAKVECRSSLTQLQQPSFIQVLDDIVINFLKETIDI